MQETQSFFDNDIHAQLKALANQISQLEQDIAQARKDSMTRAEVLAALELSEERTAPPPKASNPYAPTFPKYTFGGGTVSEPTTMIRNDNRKFNINIEIASRESFTEDMYQKQQHDAIMAASFGCRPRAI